MSSSGLFSEVKKHPWILALVILLHVGVVILLSINLSNDEKPPMPAAQKNKIINAVAVDAKKYDDREKQKKHAVQKKQDAEKKRQQELKQKKAQEKKRLEQKRLADKKKAEQKKVEKKKLEQKKAAAVAAALALKKKKEQERLIKENERKAQEKKERERIVKEKKEQERLAAEKKRKAEEERQRRAEEKAEFENALLEEERLREQAKQQAERAARLQTLREQYIMLIKQKVDNNWLRPVMTGDGQSCEVIVTQAMSGDVMDVRLQSCTSDEAFQRSVESAVYKASPLPLPLDPELFDRKIHFTFKPRL